MPGKDNSSSSSHAGDMHPKTDLPSHDNSHTSTSSSASSVTSVFSAMTRGQILPREDKPAAAVTTSDDEEEDGDFVFIGKDVEAMKARDDDDDDGTSSSSGSSGGVRLSKRQSSHDEPEEGEKLPEYDEDLATALLCEEDEE